ncbi:unnamed protein product [Clonostachys rhizophaga]|uniref:DNA (cytosine-5-)-methyltransferase n=1 Tax=Clonostachys rhizophaga TaxID=160324 RepID=A0A9N9YGK8_9HYPO|nr:unnamed protein product [Clonostachys rhizophaga]
MPGLLSLDPGGDLEVLFERQSGGRRSRGSSVSSTCTVGREEPVQTIFLDLSSDDEVIDLTIDDSETTTAQIKYGEHALTSYRGPSGIIKPGDFVEVQLVKIGKYQVNFILISAIVRTIMGEHKIRGIPYIRNRYLCNMLPKKRNEVCQILHFDKDDVTRAPTLVDANIRFVRKPHTLIITNAVWPQHSVASPCVGLVHGQAGEGRVAEETDPLVCRWKFEIRSLRQAAMFKPLEECLVRVHESEVSEAKYRVAEAEISNIWRGRSYPGGSWPLEAEERPTTDTKTNGHRPTPRSASQKYTLFDSFAGAGGVSRGAKMAGLKVTHAIDKAAEVWPTYRTNFPDTRLFQGSVDEYVRAEKRCPRADFLHLSPPCQFFSPAHTRESVHDDTNIFALFSCGSLIDKVRPRIVTVEQTFGITHDRHRMYLCTLINDFTQYGYSVRWKIVKLCTWGSAQDRKRLIMIAAAPGERLPPYPDALYSENGAGGLKPFVTIREALQGIRQSDPLHDTSTVKHFEPPRPSYNPDRLAGTLTTSGSDSCYPDGTRDFTLREFACLQGFPWYHRFRGTRTSIKRQIGNAFPPNTVMVLYQHLESWLLKQDGMTRHQPSLNNIICLTDRAHDAIEIIDAPVGYPPRQQKSIRQQNQSYRMYGSGMHEPLEIEDHTTAETYAPAQCGSMAIDLTW